MRDRNLCLVCSDDRRSVSPRDFVRVFGAFVRVSLLENLDDEEVSDNANEDALVKRVDPQVVELVVKAVNFLEALQVAVTSRRVRNGPHAEVVHVRHHSQVVFERNLFAKLFLGFQEFVVVNGLTLVIHGAQVVSEVPIITFQISMLFHLYFPKIILINYKLASID